MKRHIQLLFWLRWKYLWRGSRAQRFGFVFSLLIAILVSAALYFGVVSAMRIGFQSERLDPAEMWELVTLGFTMLYLLWLYVGSFTDLYDPGRLAPYPISPRAIFLGSTLSSFAGASLVFGGGLMAGFVVGAGGTAAQVAARVALFLVLIVHLQMVARVMRLLFLGILTSRRWRDATILISTIMGGSFYAFHLMVTSGKMKNLGAYIMPYIESGSISKWLCWFPGVWASWAFSLEGNRAILGGVLLLLSTSLVYALGGWAERRLAFSEPVFNYRPKKQDGLRPGHFLGAITRVIVRIFGNETAAVARKELSVFLRDPTIRYRILTNVFYILIPLIAPFVAKRGSLPMGESPNLFRLANPVVLFAEIVFLTNIFGTEGTAIRTLLSYPTSRRRIFLGKNLAYFGLFVPFNLAILTGTAILLTRMSQEPSSLMETLPRDLVFHLASFVVVLAVGNVSSVFFPLKILSPGARMVRQESDGCMLMVLRGVALLLLGLLVSPIVGISFFLDQLGPAWALLVPILAAVFAGVLYFVGLHLAESALMTREEKMGDYFKAA